jgi:hypothetical protein
VALGIAAAMAACSMLERLLVPLVSEADIESLFEEFLGKGRGAVRDGEMDAFREEVHHIVSCTSHTKIKDVREMFTSWHGRTEPQYSGAHILGGTGNVSNTFAQSY